MSELVNHGTGWAESEVLLDLHTLYESWDADGDTAPDFTTAQQRLQESFNTTGLLAFSVTARILVGLIDHELAQRAGNLNR